MDFHNERIRSGAAMAFHHFWRILHDRGDPGKDITNNRHADKSGDWHADFHWIDIAVIADNYAGFFHALYPLHDSWGCESHSPSQFSVREPTVDLQLLQQLPANLIK